MTFKQFAFNNVKRNARQYMSYFFSCMFSVSVFFIYAVIMFHPEIDGHEFRQTVQRGIAAVEIIIFSFSFLFVMYSTGAFIKSRKKEYGLLMTLGISKGQLNRLLILENTIIGCVSIVAGLLIGTLFANVFIMGFSNMIDIDGSLGFAIAPKAVLLTVVSYFVMFELNTLAITWTMRTNAVVDLFRGAKAAKRVPKFSWILSIIGLGLVITAYSLAWTADLLSIFPRMFPILLLIIPGTYLLFTQSSVALINLLRRNKSIYFRQTNLLTISDLYYKLKDHSRLLFFVTILSAVAFTASGVLFGAYQSAKTEAEALVAQDVSLLSKGEEHIANMDDEVSTFKQQLEQKGIDYQSLAMERTQAKIHHMDQDIWVDLLSVSNYKQLQKLNGNTVDIDVSNDEMVVMLPRYLTPGEEEFANELTVTSENVEETFTVQTMDTIVNQNTHNRYTIVVSDEMYQHYASVQEPNEQYRYVAFSIHNWSSHAEAIYDSTHMIDREIVTGIDTQAQIYLTLKNSLSFALFFGLFISVLFFLAAGSILYFKMYQDLDNDVSRYRSLYRIGLTVKEMKKIATKQVAYLFFIPFSVAVIHASFAFKALQNMLTSSVFMPSLLLISCYLAIYAIYFFFIRGLYIRKLKEVM
ncbi:hypothetical protein J416_09941 [Gracilibacillus halophilus YIM-C55.5]|uniref:ABC3 transporter permease C-terminal domain-containing protein n=1 Tax=Gracilibacillus halophilus YIM-C55.5 TaxID=1308866 RepID=N4WU15_9BACI|nr:FtsX-like permease family protein [Gracilibacillus halophilus]ENH96591.1 hypothetical protein J416_09941 [Gracilibacillus halophilus YIM-C55.5]